MKLPIKKITLYKHGVGHFIHEGEVDGAQELVFTFPSKDMNDVLKSLSIFDEQQQAVSVKYEPLIPFEQRNNYVAHSLKSAVGLQDLLTRLRGALVKLTVTGLHVSAVQGRILTISTGARPQPQPGFGGAVTQSSGLEVLLLVDNTSMIERISLDNIINAQVLEKDLSDGMVSALDLLMEDKKSDLKTLRIQTSGNAKRTVRVAYIVEAPLWKASYRVVLPDRNNNNRSQAKKEALEAIARQPCWVQGWAIIDNGTQFDWEQVSLSLASGMPLSFIYDLYPFKFNIRPFIDYGGGVDKTVGAVGNGELSSKAKVIGIRPTNWNQQQNAQTFGKHLNERVFPPQQQQQQQTLAFGGGSTFSGFSSAPTSSSVPTPGGFGSTVVGPDTTLQPTLAVEMETQTIEVGDLFQYEISTPVSVEKGQSASVPFFQENMDGNRVSYFNASYHPDRVFSALRLKNNTTSTLEMGPITVLEANQYVGETITEILRPKEEKILPYSVEFSCQAAIKRSETLKLPGSITVAHGTLSVKQDRIYTTAYSFRNRSNDVLDFILEHPNSEPGRKLLHNDRWIFTNRSLHRFRFSVDPNSTFTFEVVESSPDVRTLSLQQITRLMLKRWKKQGVIDDSLLDMFSQLLDKSESLAQLGQQIMELKQTKYDLRETMNELRANLYAIQHSNNSAVDNLVQKLNATQEEMDQLMQNMKQLKRAWQTKSAELLSEIEHLEFRSDFNQEISLGSIEGGQQQFSIYAALQKPSVAEKTGRRRQNAPFPEHRGKRGETTGFSLSSTPVQQATTSPFGGPTQQATNSLFGAPAQQATNSLFGSLAQQSQQAQSAFGSAPQTTSLFGTGPTPQLPVFSGFSSTSVPHPATSAFGASPSTSFGMPSQPSGGFGFPTATNVVLNTEEGKLHVAPVFQNQDKEKSFEEARIEHKGEHKEAEDEEDL